MRLIDADRLKTEVEQKLLVGTSVIRLMDEQPTVSFIPKVEMLVDTIISHNEIVALWCEIQSKENGRYSELLWRGMAWDIPEEYKKLAVVRLFGTIPESIWQADTINILVEKVEQHGKIKLEQAIEHAKEVSKQKYTEGMLCHANPDDGLLDGCIECGKQHEQLATWLEKLKTYEDAEEQGLLLKLPCKVGDTAYHVIRDNIAVPPVYISEHQIQDVSAKSVYFADDWWTFEEMHELNAFLNREEAEAALAKMESEVE